MLSSSATAHKLDPLTPIIIIIFPTTTDTDDELVYLESKHSQPNEQSKQVIVFETTAPDHKFSHVELFTNVSAATVTHVHIVGIQCMPRLVVGEDNKNPISYSSKVPSKLGS